MEKLTFLTTDNLNLCGILNEAGSDTCVVMCHGFCSNKDTKKQVLLAEKLAELGVDSFRFDFRGNGESDGEFSEITISGEVEDLKAALNLIKSKSYKKIIICASSFAGGVASLIDYSKYKEVVALILINPYLKYETGALNRKLSNYIGNGLYEINNQRGEKVRLKAKMFEEIEEFKPYESIKLCKLPKLFIHGNADSVIPINENSINISKESQNSHLIVIKDGKHGLANTPEILNNTIEEIIKFIKHLVWMGTWFNWDSILSAILIEIIWKYFGVVIKFKSEEK